ncbi:MAG: ferritin [Bacteroidota bacterium]
MISKAVEKNLNEQVTREAYSSQLYLAMASWAETSGFGGVAAWLYAQAEEERMHMLKFLKYINERDGKAGISAIDAPPSTFGNIPELFEKVLEHEHYISRSINDLVGTAIEEKDFTTHSFLQWFVNEQIEEEASVRAILDKLRLVGEQNMYIFDRDIMSLRTTGGTAR